MMKKSKLFAAMGGIALVVISMFLIAADHNDAPIVSGTTADLTDFYAFQGENNDNFVFVATLQGLLTPGISTGQAVFDEDVLIEFNIDYNNDLKEDLVIQAIKRRDSMYFFGPSVPEFTGSEGTKSTILATSPVTVKISTVEEVQIGEKNGIKVFAGPREDPSFFDINQFKAVANKTATSFNSPGSDAFAEKNALSVVIEFPKSLLPAATVGVNPFAANTPIYNVWVESKRKI